MGLNDLRRFTLPNGLHSCSVLVYAISLDNSAAVSLLIGNRADVNARQKNEDTPLMVAAASLGPNSLAIVKSLLAAKADPTLYASYDYPCRGYTALFYALSTYPQSPAVSLSKALQIVHAGVPLTTPCGVLSKGYFLSRNISHLGCAIVCGMSKKDIVALCKVHSSLMPEHSIVGHEGHTPSPLAVAAYWGRVDIIPFLLGRGADPEEMWVDSNTQSVVQIAQERRQRAHDAGNVAAALRYEAMERVLVAGAQRRAAVMERAAKERKSIAAAPAEEATT